MASASSIPGGVGSKEGDAAAQLFLDRLDHFRMSMTDQHGAGAEQEVDILVAAFVPDTPATALSNNDGGIEVSKTARGQHPRGALDQTAFGIGLLGLHHGGVLGCGVDGKRR